MQRDYALLDWGCFLRILFAVFLTFGGFAWGIDDLDNILVDNPHAFYLTELPSGDFDLKSYRASEQVLIAYAQAVGLQDPSVKDYPKAPECTRAEIDVLKRWVTNDIYREVNRTLRYVRKGFIDGKKVSTDMENQILVLSSAVNCAPQFKGEVVRTEQTPEVILDQYQAGNHVLMRAFTSTTKGKLPASTIPQLGASRIHIEWATGADIDALGISPWPDEKEVLIRPSTVFKVRTRTPLDIVFGFKWQFYFDPY